MSSSGRVLRLRLVAASLRWRAGTSIAMLAVGVTAVAAGVFGPVYLASAQRSVLVTTLTSADVANNGLTLLAGGGAGALSALRRAASAVPRTTDDRPLFGAPIVTLSAPLTTSAATTGQRYSSVLVARTGACQHLTFVSGHCPDAGTTVALSTRSARELGLRVGDRLTLRIPKDRRPVALPVVGLYRPGSDQAPFWWGENYFGNGFGTTAEPSLDDVFATAATVRTVAPAIEVTAVVQLPLHTMALVAEGSAAFERALSTYETRVRADDGVTASTLVQQPIAQASAADHPTTTIVLVIDVQLVLLCLLVLFFTAADSAEARQPDLTLAELRGYSRRGRAALSLTEPLCLLALAVPCGLVLAWVAARVAAPHLFVTGVSPSIGGLAVGAALLTFAAGAVATALGSRGIWSRRSRQWGGPARRTGTSLALAVDAVVVAVAVAAVLELTVAGVGDGVRADPLAALAPGLLAVAAGIVGARLLPLGARASLAATRDSRWVGTSLGTRRVARRPELSRHVVVLSLAVGLATFSVAGWAVARQNRSARSQFSVGASTVLTVEVRPGVDLLEAVRRADPSGRQAMAAVLEQAPYGQLLAVDASRLSTVAYWPSGPGWPNVHQISRALAPVTAAPVVLHGDSLAVTADLVHSAEPPPALEATVFSDASQSGTTLDLGPLAPGTHRYRAPFGGACTPNCRLDSLALVWTPPGVGPAASDRVVLRLRAIADQSSGGRWSTVDAGLDDPRRWQSGTGGATITRAGPALTLRATVTSDGAPALVGPADVPAELPAVLTEAGTGAGGGGPPESVGLDGATITVRPVATVPALPGASPEVTLVDLALAQRIESGPMTDATPQVWVAPDASPRLVPRLEAAGVVPVASRAVAVVDASLSHSGISLAYSLFPVVAGAAVLLALGSTVFAVVVTARRRRRDLASLLAAGVPPGALRRSLSIEHGLVIATGVVVGAAAGATAATVALRSVPEFVQVGVAPPLAFGLPVGALALLVGSLVVAFGLIVAIATRVVLRHATAAPPEDVT